MAMMVMHLKKKWTFLLITGKSMLFDHVLCKAMISLKTTSDVHVTLRQWQTISKSFIYFRHPHKMLASVCAELVARNWQW